MPSTGIHAKTLKYLFLAGLLAALCLPVPTALAAPAGTVINNQASRAMIAPAVPRALKRIRSNRLPISPPPQPSSAACSASSTGTATECMAASSHRKNNTIPNARSSESGGSFSIRRRTSHAPITINPAGRM